MSEFQYVYFAAVDQALDDEQLAFMQRQSSRAKISRWEFENEYNYSDFRGNDLEMLRRGYDVHLRFANYGVRKLAFRLPCGLPSAIETLSAYAIDESIVWTPDGEGTGGVLTFEPEGDADTFDSYYAGFDSICKSLPRLRDRLMVGDLRPLYLLWLVCEWEEDAVEPPVPGGMQALPDDLLEFARFYEVPLDLVDAAAQVSPEEGDIGGRDARIEAWMKARSKADLRDMLYRVLDGDGAAVRAETLSAIRNQHGSVPWPTIVGERTRGLLEELSESIRVGRKAREAEAEQRAHQEQIAAIQADPAAAIAKAEKHVAMRSSEDYQQAAHILSELRDALGPVEGPKTANAVAQKLVKNHPTLNRLKSALSAKGLNYEQPGE